MATKTLSIRVDDNDYKFLSHLAKEEKENVSKAVRELVDLGRVMLAIEKYKKIRGICRKGCKNSRGFYLKNDGHIPGLRG